MNSEGPWSNITDALLDWLERLQGKYDYGSITSPKFASITCPKCGMTSFNPNDIREGYCGNCHDWTGKR